MTHTIPDHIHDSDPPAISLSELFPTLSKRQREVCALLIQGMENKEIARRFDISPRTVEDHRTEIFKRVKVSNVRGLVYKALGSPEIRA